MLAGTMYHDRGGDEIELKRNSKCGTHFHEQTKHNDDATNIHREKGLVHQSSGHSWIERFGIIMDCPSFSSMAIFVFLSLHRNKTGRKNQLNCTIISHDVQVQC